jgi:hypothetical protein
MNYRQQVFVNFSIDRCGMGVYNTIDRENPDRGANHGRGELEPAFARFQPKYLNHSEAQRQRESP